MAHGGWEREELAALGPLFARAAQQYSSPWCERRGPAVHTAASRRNEVTPLHMIRSHDGLDSAVSSDAPDVWRLPNVPLIDRRLGYPAAYVTENRWAPEIPEMPANTSEWAGSKSAVSPAAPLEFRLGNAVPLFHREHKGQIARVKSTDEYTAYEAAQRANVAAKVKSSQLKKKGPPVKPAVAWLSHTQRRDSSRAASADAPGWMQTSAHHHRIIYNQTSANLTFVPNPTTGASSRPMDTLDPAQRQRPRSAAMDLTRSIAAASTSAIALLEKTTHLRTHEATRSPHRLEGTMLRCIPREQWPFFVVIPVDTRRSGLHTTLRILAGSAFSQAGRVPPGGHSTGHAARLA